jgi:hypothetical protein
MKKNLLITCILLLTGSVSFAQPDMPVSFSYQNYVTEPRDQLIQNPCFAHATIAGIEAMYNLHFGKVLDLSERALFYCSGQIQDLGMVLSYAQNYGTIDEIDPKTGEKDPETKYPDPPATGCNPEDMPTQGIIKSASYNCQTKQNDRGFRFRIVKESVNMTDANTIKKYLMSYGPIIFTYTNPKSVHAMLLIGWNDTGWLVKDSWPCNKVYFKTIPFGGPYENLQESPYVMFKDAYIITSITKEKYNKTTNTWSIEVAPPIQYQNFGFLKIVKKSTPNPLCFNRGIVYELIGLDSLIDAEVTWSYAASGTYNSNVSLTVSPDKKTCTVSGNAAGVTLYAIINKHTGIREKISLPVGTIGIPSKLTSLNGHCAGTNYEITSKIEHPIITGCTYSYNYNIPNSSDGSYYVIKSGQYAYWVFKTPNGLQYSATVTANQPGCSSISNTQYAIIYSQWCGTSYKSTTDKDLSDSEENSPLVSPNPVRNDLKLTHIGKGTNDIRIYDLSGSLVYSVKTAQTVTVDVSMIPRGIYIVRYFVDDAVNQARPIKIVLE